MVKFVVDLSTAIGDMKRSGGMVRVGHHAAFDGKYLNPKKTILFIYR
jgi:hypothetical protein